LQGKIGREIIWKDPISATETLPANAESALEILKSALGITKFPLGIDEYALGITDLNPEIAENHLRFAEFALTNTVIPLTFDESLLTNTVRQVKICVR